MTTENQRARQRAEYRNKGKYAQVNPCYVCGKSAGINYSSHHDTDVTIGDDLLCLCSKCMKILDKLDGKSAIKKAEEMSKEMRESK